MLTRPIVLKSLLAVSMAHVSLDDQDRLYRSMCPEVDNMRLDHPHWWMTTSSVGFLAYPVSGGWIIHIHDSDSIHASDGTMPPFSSSFTELLKWAVQQGVDYLRLDADVTPTTSLPVFYQH